MPRTRKAAKRSPPTRRPSRPGPRRPVTRGFVGRDPSPVLDHYPPKDPSLSVRGPPPPPASAIRPAPPAPRPTTTSTTATSAPAPPATAAAGSGEPPKGLISLERPFDIDDLSRLLGETTIRIEVPREELAEALKRVSEFMGFGIYVYRFEVRPASEELLKRFVVELQRVDFHAEKGDWLPFEEKGRSDSPFGPTGTRR